MSKVIVIDWSIFLHKAIFCLRHNPSIPATYNCLNMILGMLYRIGVDPDDTIVVALDARNSWRKDYETAYKGDRKEKKKASGIDWDYWYGEFDRLEQSLNAGLDWHFIRSPRCEADDVMAVCCRYFKDQEVILMTHDADLHQMYIYDHVKIFSTMTKEWRPKPPAFDLTRLQSEKIYKEATDNMVTPILSEEDFNTRKMCVDLISLPEWVEEAIGKELDKVGPKDLNISSVPFKSLHLKIANVYNDTSKIINYDAQVAKDEAKVLKEKNKKIAVKEKAIRMKVRAEKKIENEKIKQDKILARIKKLEKKKVIDDIKEKLKGKKEKHNGTVYQGSGSEKHVEVEDRGQRNMGVLS